jgi:hypothetical protein
MVTTNTSDGSSAHVDFSGTWECTGVTGAPSKFLEALGVSWLKRQAAYAANYGVGGQQIIKQLGSVLEITSQGKTRSVHVGGGLFSFETPDGNVKSAEAVWDDACIHTTIDGGMEMRRVKEGDKMVMKLAFCRGMERVEMIRTLKRIG